MALGQPLRRAAAGGGGSPACAACGAPPRTPRHRFKLAPRPDHGRWLLGDTTLIPWGLGGSIRRHSGRRSTGQASKATRDPGRPPVRRPGPDRRGGLAAGLQGRRRCAGPLASRDVGWALARSTFSRRRARRARRCCRRRRWRSRANIPLAPHTDGLDAGGTIVGWVMAGARRATPATDPGAARSSGRGAGPSVRAQAVLFPALGVAARVRRGRRPAAARCKPQRRGGHGRPARVKAPMRAWRGRKGGGRQG
jgi:hypothetical protein